MIDIVKDYAAISVGTAQATGAKLMEASRVGAGSALAWSASTIAELRQDPRAAAAQAPTALAQAVHGGVERAAGWMGSASTAQARRMRRHAAWAGGRLQQARRAA